MNELNGYDIENLRLGISATFSKPIPEADSVLIDRISGDSNALRVNEEFAHSMGLRGHIAHRLLTGCIISTVVEHCEGPVTVMAALMAERDTPQSVRPLHKVIPV